MQYATDKENQNYIFSSMLLELHNSILPLKRIVGERRAEIASKKWNKKPSKLSSTCISQSIFNVAHHHHLISRPRHTTYCFERLSFRPTKAHIVARRRARTASSSSHFTRFSHVLRLTLSRRRGRHSDRDEMETMYNTFLFFDNKKISFLSLSKWNIRVRRKVETFIIKIDIERYFLISFQACVVYEHGWVAVALWDETTGCVRVLGWVMKMSSGDNHTPRDISEHFYYDDERHKWLTKDISVIFIFLRCKIYQPLIHVSWQQFAESSQLNLGYLFDIEKTDHHCDSLIYTFSILHFTFSSPSNRRCHREWLFSLPFFSSSFSGVWKYI